MTMNEFFPSILKTEMCVLHRMIINSGIGSQQSGHRPNVSSGNAFNVEAILNVKFFDLFVDWKKNQISAFFTYFCTKFFHNKM